MSPLAIVGTVIYAACLVYIARRVFTRRGRAPIGPGAAGAVYDMLNHDQREAIHVIVEKKAEKQDPETRDDIER